VSRRVSRALPWLSLAAFAATLAGYIWVHRGFLNASALF
jgi:hypothetical protein